MYTRVLPTHQACRTRFDPLVILGRGGGGGARGGPTPFRGGGPGRLPTNGGAISRGKRAGYSYGMKTSGKQPHWDQMIRYIEQFPRQRFYITYLLCSLGYICSNNAWQYVLGSVWINSSGSLGSMQYLYRSMNSLWGIRTAYPALRILTASNNPTTKQTISPLLQIQWQGIDILVYTLSLVSGLAHRYISAVRESEGNQSYRPVDIRLV